MYKKGLVKSGGKWRLITRRLVRKAVSRACDLSFANRRDGRLSGFPSCGRREFHVRERDEVGLSSSCVSADSQLRIGGSACQAGLHPDLANVPFSVRSVTPLRTTIVKGCRSGPSEVAELQAQDLRVQAVTVSAAEMAKGISSDLDMNDMTVRSLEEDGGNGVAMTTGSPNMSSEMSFALLNTVNVVTGSTDILASAVRMLRLSDEGLT